MVRKQLSIWQTPMIMVSTKLRSPYGARKQRGAGIKPVQELTKDRNHEKETKLLLEKVEAILASLQSQYMDAVVDMKDDIEKKFGGVAERRQQHAVNGDDD